MSVKQISRVKKRSLINVELFFFSRRVNGLSIQKLKFILNYTSTDDG